MRVAHAVVYFLQTLKPSGIEGFICDGTVPPHMAKRISHVVRRCIEPKFARSKVVLYVGCTDGSTYVAERSLDGRRVHVRERIDPDGSRNSAPSRLPARVAGHLRWRHCETPCYLAT